MRIGLLLQRAHYQSTDGFSAEDLLRMATINGAKVLGMEKEIGSIKKGKKADIVAVDLSQSHQIPTRDPYSAVVYTVSQPNVILSMVDGKIVYDAVNEDNDKDVFRAVEKIRTKLRN